MDGYAHVLAALREDNCRRLRAYTPRPGTQFTTWLVVVARRLMLDHHRHRVGRPRSTETERRAEHATRRRLEELVAVELDPDGLTTPTEDSAEARLRRGELTEALRQALAALDAPDRLLLALRFEDERSVREIASVLGLPSVFHVYRRLNGVLATLREALARRGVSEPDP
jgi:RNA polymerase sigma factor (sigma-70 family)